MRGHAGPATPHGRKGRQLVSDTTDTFGAHDAHKSAPRGELEEQPGCQPATAVSTYSMWSLFRNCRKKFEWRYIHQLVPLHRDPALSFGALIHECLELWHGNSPLADVLSHIDSSTRERHSDPAVKADYHLARAMMQGYAARYPTEDFITFALEETFRGPIINPATGASSRTFTLAGKADGIVKDAQTGQFFLLEHKTAATIDGGYIERLWCDFQIQLYCWYIEQTLNIRIAGVIYNILAKAKLRQRQGETEQEFEQRREALIAKSKTGKSSAKRKEAEPDEEFEARLLDWYASPDAFHREVIYVSRDQIDELRGELWELTQSYLDARRRGTFYKNTGFCFQYNKPCAYFQLCRSGGSSNIIENFFRKEAPHGELDASSPDLKDEPEADHPVF